MIWDQKPIKTFIISGWRERHTENEGEAGREKENRKCIVRFIQWCFFVSFDNVFLWNLLFSTVLPQLKYSIWLLLSKHRAATRILNHFELTSQTLSLLYSKCIALEPKWLTIASFIIHIDNAHNRSGANSNKWKKVATHIIYYCRSHTI